MGNCRGIGFAIVRDNKPTGGPMLRKNKLETTLGDLIVALTDEAARVAQNQEESYRLTAAALTRLLAATAASGNVKRIRRHFQMAA
jgi:hypothetical protein